MCKFAKVHTIVDCFLLQAFVISGYTIKVPQPALGGELAFACDPRLILDDPKMASMGERAGEFTKATRITGVLPSKLIRAAERSYLH